MANFYLLIYFLTKYCDYGIVMNITRINYFSGYYETTILLLLYIKMINNHYAVTFEATLHRICTALACHHLV